MRERHEGTLKAGGHRNKRKKTRKQRRLKTRKDSYFLHACRNRYLLFRMLLHNWRSFVLVGMRMRSARRRILLTFQRRSVSSRLFHTKSFQLLILVCIISLGISIRMESAIGSSELPPFYVMDIVFTSTGQDGIVPRTWIEENGTRIENSAFKALVEKDCKNITDSIPHVKNLTLNWLIDYDDDGLVWIERSQKWGYVSIPDHGNLTAALLFLDEHSGLLRAMDWEDSTDEVTLFTQLRNLWYIDYIDYSGLPYGTASASFPGFLSIFSLLLILPVISKLDKRR